MAKFFKNYTKINLCILDKISQNLSESELEEIKISPKYLAMTHMKDCDFCDNSKNEFTLVDEIVIMYGYQICNKCSDKNIGQTFIKKWFIDNNILRCEYYLENVESNHLFNQNVSFKIQRSNSEFDDGWKFDKFDLISYVIRDDETEDLKIPFYKFNIRSKTLYKSVYLSELCRFYRELNETDLIKLFKSLLLKLKLT